MNVEDSPNIHPHRDEQSEDELGGTEYVWDSSDEQEEGDTKKTGLLWDSMDEEDRTSKRNVGDQRLKGGGEQETFG